MRSERKIPFFLIWRHVRRTNKWTLLLIIFLMSIAFINLIFINSLFQGVVEADHKQIIETTNGNISLAPAEGQEFIANPLEVVRKIDRVQGVAASAPETTVPATLEIQNARNNLEVWAIDPELEKRVTNISRKILSGSYLAPGSRFEMIVGRDLAAAPPEAGDNAPDRIHLGDRLNIVVGASQARFTVRGIFRTKFERADGRVFITRAALDKLTPEFKDKATNIVIKTDEVGNEDQVVSRLKAAGIQGTFTTWQQAAAGVKSLTDSFVTINALLTVVGFFIAAVTIFIIMYVDISHKRLEIGILRAIGVKSYLIGATFVFQTIVYSFCGVALGTALFFGIIVPYFIFHPFSIPIGDVNLAVVPYVYVVRAFAVVLVATVSGLIPAVISLRKKILDEILGR
jgi:putative ABC transport system permease protein